MVDLKKKTFLLVESVAEMRMAITLALSNFGVTKVTTTSQPKELLRHLSTRSYDVIICDYTFGGKLDGLALLQEIHQRRLINLGTVFIIVTTERSAATVIAALDYSPDDYLLKPFTANALLNRLKKAFERKPAFDVLDRLIRNHDYLGAIEECDVRINEGNAHQLEFTKIKGRLSLLTADFAGAQKLYEQVLEAAPVEWATMGLGKSLQNQHEFDKAIDLFQSIIDGNNRVMEAYDLLADSHQSNGDSKIAQEVLQRAVTILPNDLKRQQKLGEVAWENGDFDVAEQTFRQCLVLGREQASTDADNHIKLCKLLLDKGDVEGALTAIQALRKALSRDPIASLSADLIESMIYKKSGEQSKAQELYTKFKKAVAAYEAELPESILLDRVAAGLLFDDEADIEPVVRKLLRNNVEGSLIRHKIVAIYEKEGKGAQIRALMDAIMAELIAQNNRAVILAKSGDLKGAVELFIQAVADMPNNARFIVNASNGLLAYVNLAGWDEAYMTKVKEFITRIADLDPTNPALQQLVRIREATAKKFNKE